jgi:hypothetical protein
MPILPNKVLSGDLITSDFMNQLVDVCADLQLRVSQLEKPAVAPAGVRIDALLPSGIRRMGDELHIIGSGFDVPAGNIVSIDGIGVTPRSGADRDRELIVNIPNLQGVTSSGRNVTVQVSNVKGTDLADFLVYPAVATVPQGQVFVNYSAAPAVAGIISGQSYTLIYTVQAITDLDEDYDIAATVSSGWAAIMVDGADQPVAKSQIRLRSLPAPAGDTAVVRIRVTVPGGLADHSAGSMLVTATSRLNPNHVNGHSGGERIAVAEAPPSPFPIAITFNQAGRTTAQQPIATTDATGFVRLGAGTDNYRFNFAAQIKAGTVYRLDVTTPLDPSPPAGSGSRWFASFDAGTSLLTQNIGPVGADTSQQIFVFVHGSAGAPDGTLVLAITSTTDAKQMGKINQRVGLGV